MQPLRRVLQTLVQTPVSLAGGCMFIPNVFSWFFVDTGSVSLPATAFSWDALGISAGDNKEAESFRSVKQGQHGTTGDLRQVTEAERSGSVRSVTNVVAASGSIPLHFRRRPDLERHSSYAGFCCGPPTSCSFASSRSSWRAGRSGDSADMRTIASVVSCTVPT